MGPKNVLDPTNIKKISTIKQELEFGPTDLTDMDFVENIYISRNS